MSNVIDFFSFVKNKSKVSIPNKYVVWHNLPIVPIENKQYEIIVRVIQTENKNLPIYSYFFPSEKDILLINQERSEQQTLHWAYMKDIEKLIIDFENPQIS